MNPRQQLPEVRLRGLAPDASTRLTGIPAAELFDLGGRAPVVRPQDLGRESAKADFGPLLPRF
jgi:hypothetical protein